MLFFVYVLIWEKIVKNTICTLKNRLKIHDVLYEVSFVRFLSMFYRKMSNTIHVPYSLTIETLDVIVQQYSVAATVQNRSYHRRRRRFPNEVKQRTAFYIAKQLQDLRRALAVVVIFILLLLIPITKVVVGARCSDKMPMKSSRSFFLMVQGAIALPMILAPILLVIVHFQKLF